MELLQQTEAPQAFEHAQPERGAADPAAGDGETDQAVIGPRSGLPSNLLELRLEDLIPLSMVFAPFHPGTPLQSR